MQKRYINYILYKARRLFELDYNIVFVFITSFIEAHFIKHLYFLMALELYILI